MTPTDLLRSTNPAIQANEKRQYGWNPERRRFVRFPCAWQIRFLELTGKPSKLFYSGKCKNVSEGGIKMNALQPLSRNAVILVELNPDVFAKHIQLKKLLFVSETRVLAEVMWRHLNLETALFEAGLRFVENARRHEFEPLIERAKQIL